MSRAIKIGETVVDGINYDKLECYVGDDEEKGIKGERVEYSLPKTWADFKRLVAGASDAVGPTLWGEYNYGHGLKARAAGRPDGGGVTLPITMTKKYGSLNLVDGTFDGVLGGKTKVAAATKWAGTPVPLENRVRMLNAYLLAKAENGGSGRAQEQAIATLLAGKMVILKGDMLALAGK